jgi:hypothetical protein
MESSLTKPIPRIIRFVPAIIAEGMRLAAHLDAERNVLTIDKGIFDQLDEKQQDAIIKTRRSVEVTSQAA